MHDDQRGFGHKKHKQEKITMSVNVDMKAMFSQVKKTHDYINDSTFSLAGVSEKLIETLKVGELQ